LALALSEPSSAGPLPTRGYTCPAVQPNTKVKTVVRPAVPRTHATLRRRSLAPSGFARATTTPGHGHQQPPPDQPGQSLSETGGNAGYVPAGSPADHVTNWIPAEQSGGRPDPETFPSQSKTRVRRRDAIKPRCRPRRHSTHARHRADRGRSLHTEALLVLARATKLGRRPTNARNPRG
jgi:hypothetical protein